MNPVLAIMRKDVTRMAGPLTIWGLAGMHVLWPHDRASLPSSMFSEMQAVSMLAILMFSVVMIAWVIQEDDARAADAFWRSRPISPRMLLGSKLALLVTLFVAIPAVGILLGEALAPGFFRRIDRLPNVMGFTLCAVIVCAAIAACTRNLGEYLLVGVSVVVVTSKLITVVSEYSWVTERDALYSFDSRTRLAALTAGTAGFMALVLQYHKRRTLLSFGLIVLGVIGVCTVTAFWRWRIL